MIKTLLLIMMKIINHLTSLAINLNIIYHKIILSNKLIIIKLKNNIKKVMMKIIVNIYKD
jgi:hypothetical protein